MRWHVSSRDDLSAFLEPVRLRVGGALWDAQLGRKAPWAKPLKRFGSAGVLEVVYVLHAFQKKSKSGIATPRHEIELIEQRLKRAKEDYELWQASKTPK